MLKKVLFTHDDLDGAGCRIVYELANQYLSKGTDYLVVNCGNNNIDESVMKGLNSGLIDKDTEIIFADICASKETLEYMISNFSMPKIFDHHRTNLPVVWVVPDAVITIENELGVMQSGTSLLYQYYCGLPDSRLETKTFHRSHVREQIIGQFVDTVRSYDTYEWKTTNNIDAKKLQTLFSLLGMERFCEQYIDMLNNGDDTLINKGDLKFVDARLEREQFIIDTITPDDVYHINVRGLNTAFSLGSFGVNGSELAHQFLMKYPEFDMFATFDFWSGGAFSFRTVKDDLDIATMIAEPISGGGHARASGASISEDLRDEIVNILINYLNKDMESNNDNF